MKASVACFPMRNATDANRRPSFATLAVLEAHPEAAKEKDDRGRFPLHYAFIGRAPEAAVTVAVLHAHPAAAKVKDVTGMHPLHYALESRSPSWNKGWIK